MTLRHLRVFITVCEQNSITRAAEKLFTAQPAVSCAVKELEEHYNIKLFDRISKRLYLTEEGKLFRDYASHIVELFDDMEENIRDRSFGGKLRVGSSITIGSHYMPDYVKFFGENHPQSEIYVVIDSSDIIEQMLLRNELDFALIEGFTHNESLVCRTYMDDELTIICGPDHRFCGRDGITIGEFAAEPFLLREKGSGTRELFDNILASAGYSVIPKWESTSTVALINAVTKGLGISVLPNMLVSSYIAEGKVISVKVDGLKFRRKFNVIYHKNKYLNSSAKAFIDMCVSSAGKQKLAKG